MSLDQKRARVFGVLYLITFVTSIPAVLLYEPALRHPVAFVAGSGNVNKIYLGALLELLLIIANIGTAVVIVPIMRRFNEELAIGYVTARIFECTSGPLIICKACDRFDSLARSQAQAVSRAGCPNTLRK